jgi:cell division protein FtsI/penicillin-binding protein 2
VKSRILVFCTVLVLLGLVVLVGRHQRVRSPPAAEPGRRGPILDRNGAVLARDSAEFEPGMQDSEPGGRLERLYPLGETAANLIGFTSSADGRKGAAGLELGMDSVLSRHQGLPLRVTIDADLQRAAFQTLQRYVSSTRAARASAVAMTAATGEVLALADCPGYDPTRARMYPSEAWRVHAVTDEFTPGPLVDDSWLKAESGRTFAEELGFGRPTGIGLPDEAAGVLAESLPATRVSLLQLVQAYSAIADEGRGVTTPLHRPSLVARLPEPLHPGERAFAAQSPGSVTRDTEGGMEFLGAGGVAGQDSLSPVLIFVGVFPAGEPKYVVGVMLDRPLTGHFVPETARLLFEDIARHVGGQ